MIMIIAQPNNPSKELLRHSKMIDLFCNMDNTTQMMVDISKSQLIKGITINANYLFIPKY